MFPAGQVELFRGQCGERRHRLRFRLPTGTRRTSSDSARHRWSHGVLGIAPPLSPRASFGYTFSNGGSDFTGDLPDELNYTAGFDLALHPRFTIAADFLGRTLLDAQRLVEQDVTFRYRLRTDPTVLSTTRTTPGTETGNLGLYLASVGFRSTPSAGSSWSGTC